MAIVHIAGACWPSLIPCRRDLDMSTIIAAPCRGGRGQAGGVFPAGRCARRSEADDGPDAHDQSREVRAANSSAAIVLNQDPVPGEARIPMRRFGRRQDTQIDPDATERFEIDTETYAKLKFLGVPQSS